jgi:hypothetical protein
MFVLDMILFLKHFIIPSTFQRKRNYKREIQLNQRLRCRAELVQLISLLKMEFH